VLAFVALVALRALVALALRALVLRAPVELALELVVFTVDPVVVKVVFTIGRIQ
jgi:hypothetical protein